MALEGIVLGELESYTITRRVPVVHPFEGTLGEKLPDGLLRIEPDFAGVRANERANEDPARQSSDVVPLQRLERNYRDLRRGGNLLQGGAAAQARLTKGGTEVQLGVHRLALTPPRGPRTFCPTGSSRL